MKKVTSSRICNRLCLRRTGGSPCPTGQTTWCGENILMIWTQQKKPAGNCVNQNCDGRGSFFDIVLSSSEVITVVFDYDDHPRNWLWADSLKYLFLFRYEIKSTCKWSYQVSLTKKDKWRCGKHCQGQSSRLLPRLWWGERWRNMKPKSLVK